MTASTPAPSGLRARTRRAVQAEIADAAMQLFVEQGFEATTMDQVADAAGVSRRSLFRYFSTKEDVVLGHLVEAGLVVKEALEARPLSEPPWQALRAALASVALRPGYSEERNLAVCKMLYGSPTLHAAHLEKQLRWRELLVPNIAHRLGDVGWTAPDPGPDAIVASVLACLDSATEAWTRLDGHADLGALFDRAAAAVRG